MEINAFFIFTRSTPLVQFKVSVENCKRKKKKKKKDRQKKADDKFEATEYDTIDDRECFQMPQKKKGSENMTKKRKRKRV